MATVKNFGLKGVGNQIQFGKSGGQLDYGVNTGSEFSVTAADGSTVGQLNIALTPSAINHATSKQYVDSVVTGLDVKKSVLVATVSVTDLSGFTYTASSDDESENAAPWTGVASPVFDGVTLTDQDRVLIKDAADAKGNGIFFYDSGSSTFKRSTDADNTPGDEVSGGMFTFVEAGDTQADNGYVMDSPTGNATLGTSNLTFSQFSGAGQITAGDGLTKDGNTIDVVGSATIIANANDVEVNSSSTQYQILVSSGSVGTASTFGALDLDQGASHTGTLGLANGGTNTDTDGFSVGGIALWQDTSVTELASVATGSALISQGAGSDPVYGDIDLTTTVTGLLPLANGGTNANLTAANGGIVYSDASAMAILAAGSDGQLLQSGGANAPNWTTSTYPDGGIADRSILITAAANTVSALTVTPNSEDQVLLWDDVADNFVFVNSNTLGSAYSTITTDSGSVTAIGSETLNIQGLANGGLRTVGTTPGTDTVTIALTIDDLADGSAETVLLTTEMALNLTGEGDTVTARKFTFTDVVDDLDIPHGTTAVGGLFRIATDDGGNDYTSRTFAVSIVSGDEGLSIVDGDGVSGAPTYGLDILGLTLDSTVVGTDNLVAYNGTNNVKITASQLVSDMALELDIPFGFDSNGFLARTADDTYIERSIVESAANGLEGIDVLNGDGGSGNPTVGLDINGLTENTAISGTDKLVIFDGTNNRKVNVSEVIADSVVAFKIVAGDSGPNAVADTSVDTLNLIGATDGGITTISANDDEVITFGLTLTDLAAGGDTLALADFIAINDSGDIDTVLAKAYTFTDIVDDLNIPHGTTAVGGLFRIATDNGGDDYTSRTFAVSTVDGDEGLSIVNGDGVSGAPTYGLDIVGLAANTTSAGSDFLVLYDGTNNRKITVDTFVAAGNQNLWLSFDADGGGPVSANITTDTFNIVGGSDISTSISGDTLTITNDAPNVDNPDQNLWATITANSGSTTADSLTDSLAIIGSIIAGQEGIITSIAADVVSVGLNIVGLVGDNVASVALNDGGGGYSAANTVTLSGGTGTFATITVDSVNGSGTILTFTLLTTGSYTVDPTPLIANPVTGGDGSAATFDITMNGVSGSDILVIYDGVNNRKITIDELVADTVDHTRITDGTNTYVDTDEVAGKVTINTDDGTGGSGTQLLATFGAASGSSTVTDANFLFTNEDAVDTGGNDEIQICAVGTETDIDVRIKPKGAGKVFLGEAGTDATISSSDGTAGENLTILAGDGSSTTGGNITLTPGDGDNGTDGTICITDADSVNVMCFEGDSATTAVSYLTVTNSPTGGQQVGSTAPEIKAVSSDSNVDIGFLPKGTGTLSVSGTTDYEDNVTEDDDIPNKAYVDSVVSSGSKVLFDTLDDDGLVTGTNSIPLNADITRVVVEVTAPYDGTTGFDIGTAAGLTRVTDDSADEYVDWQTNGIYIIENHELASEAASLFLLTKSAGSSGTGAGTIRVEFVTA